MVGRIYVDSLDDFEKIADRRYPATVKLHEVTFVGKPKVIVMGLCRCDRNIIVVYEEPEGDKEKIKGKLEGDGFCVVEGCYV